MDQTRRSTLSDVARLAGLSASSVSRALSGNRQVTPDVAERARRAADQLGYRPDSVARSLRTRTTQTLGLVVADVTNPFFALLIKAVEQKTRSVGYSLLLADAQNDVRIEEESVNLLLDNRIEGLLFSPAHRFLSAHTVATAARSVRVVQLDRVADDSVPFVRIDQRDGMRQVIDHLVGRGRRTFGFIGSDSSVSTSWERQEAFVDLTAAIDPGAAIRVLSGDFSVEWGRRAARIVRDNWPDVDALVCANDLIALGAREAMTAEGLTIPGDIAIAGFDDTVIAGAGNLTSVRQPLSALAAEAVRRCLPGYSESAHSAEPLIPELVVRASTQG